MKLQAKLLFPESTSQGLVEEFQNTHDSGQSYFLTNLRGKICFG